MRTTTKKSIVSSVSVSFSIFREQQTVIINIDDKGTKALVITFCEPIKMYNPAEIKKTLFLVYTYVWQKDIAIIFIVSGAQRNVAVVVAHIYPPVTGQRQTLSCWTIRTLFITRTTS